MHQFDIPDKKKGNVVDNATQELHKLAGNIEHKELLFQSSVGQQDGDGDRSKDNMEGWVNEQDKIFMDKIMALESAIQLVHFLLTKVSCL